MSHLISSSNIYLVGNTSSGNALSVQQLGTGNVATFRTTTGATALFVGANGNVGVGTTSPCKFQVDNGTGTGLNTFIQASGITAGQTTGFLLGKALSSYNCATMNWNHVGDGLGTNYLGIGAYANDSKLNITAGGNVGIGTTNPQTTLQVSGPANTATNRTTPYANAFVSVTNDIFYGTTGQVGLEIGSGTRASGDNDRVYKYVLNTINNAAVGAGVDFQILGVPTAPASYTSDGTARNRMTIRYDGNVGIGTASPGNLLTVNNGTTDGTVCRLVGGNGATSLAGPSIDFSISNLPTYSGASIKSLNSYTDGSGQSAHLAFYTANWNGSTGSLQERMRITSAGNVGIGTTNPGSALQVGTADINYIAPSTWQEYVIGTNGCIPNTSTGQSITGNMFVASSATYARNKGGGICLGGRGYDFGGGNQLMPFGRISGVQNAGTDGYQGDLVFEVQYSGNLYERARITNNGLGVTGTFSATSTKSFDIPHPSLENKRLVHACIEAPRVDLIYRNTKQLIDGTATVNIDRECTKDIDCAMTEGTFEALCINPQIFLQNMTGFDPVIGSISGNILTIRCKNTESNDTISWMVVAERHDATMVSSNTATTNSDGYLITEYTPI